VFFLPILVFGNLAGYVILIARFYRFCFNFSFHLCFDSIWCFIFLDIFD